MRGTGSKYKRWKVPSKDKTPITLSYLPELDVTPELEPDGLQFHKQLIYMLRWAKYLGILDILYEVSLLSEYQAYPI